jgi:hypothetical protein
MKRESGDERANSPAMWPDRYLLYQSASAGGAVDRDAIGAATCGALSCSSALALRLPPAFIRAVSVA